jgi:DNA polymerase-3 subunit epsilon
MREIVLDTETTGFEPSEGHRIVEIGAIELFNHMPTGKVYHQYINPERAMPIEAFQVHGLGDDFLRDKPRFAEIATAFLEFIGDGFAAGDPQCCLRHEVPERRTELGGSANDRQ